MPHRPGASHRTVPPAALAALNARFDDLVRVNPQTGCVEWRQPLHPSGWARVWFRDRTWSVARLAWLLDGRVLPAGARLWRSCRTPGCVAVEHLVPKTYAAPAAHGTTATKRRVRRAPMRGDTSLAALARRLGVTVSQTERGFAWSAAREAE